jgi:hypothetical protein
MMTDPRTLAAGKPGDARLIQENRVPRRAIFVAVGLLAPLFTVGYAAGRLTAPVARVEMAAMVNPPSQALAAQQSAPPKAGDAAKAQKPARRKIRRGQPQPVASSAETTAASVAGESNPVGASR